ncbi:unnamed protein product, partial [Gongylonema pulchrum]|uniref:ZZ-type domain-containing protein n=1 Tax=Gongylonema pulchrum TaxID=637853 RepID=A0A183DIU5_9BILA
VDVVVPVSAVPKRRSITIQEDESQRSSTVNSPAKEITRRGRHFSYHGDSSSSTSTGGSEASKMHAYRAALLSGLGGGILSSKKVPEPGTVVLHPRNPRPGHDCKHRNIVRRGEYCSPDCDKCPKWGAPECLYGRHRIDLAYCDLCPHYGAPGCIFGGESVFGRRKRPEKDSQEMTEISKAFG